MNRTLLLGARVEEEIAKGGRILVERDGEVHELELPSLTDAQEAIRPPLRQGRLERIQDPIEILDEAKYEEVMSDLRR